MKLKRPLSQFKSQIDCKLKSLPQATVKTELRNHTFVQLQLLSHSCCRTLTRQENINLDRPWHLSTLTKYFAGHFLELRILCLALLSRFELFPNKSRYRTKYIVCSILPNYFCVCRKNKILAVYAASWQKLRSPHCCEIYFDLLRTWYGIAFYARSTSG